MGVIISDTFGRAWREGQTNIAIGVSASKRCDTSKVRSTRRAMSCG